MVVMSEWGDPDKDPNPDGVSFVDCCLGGLLPMICSVSRSEGNTSSEGVILGRKS